MARSWRGSQLPTQGGSSFTICFIVGKRAEMDDLRVVWSSPRPSGGNMADDSRVVLERSYRRALPCVALALAGLAVVAATGSRGTPRADAQAKATREGTHGALAMSEQEKLLDKLALGLNELP